MENNFELSKKQTIALDWLESPGVEELLYGGAKGGGKSVFFCIYALIYAEMVINLCKIKKQEHPPVIGFLGRKRGTDFSKTTLETWKKIVPASYYKIHEQKKEIVLWDLVRFHFGGLDDEENINRFNSAEYGVVGVDQAEELDRDDAGMLRGTQGRSSVNGVRLPIKTLFTANPGECFLEQDFGLIEGTTCPDNRKFVQALPSDNNFIDAPAYVNRLMEAWAHHPELIDAYVRGIWGGLKGGTFLFHRDTCQQSINLNLPIAEYPQILVTCDPAWLGERTDEIVIRVIKDNRIVDRKDMFNERTNITAAECVKFAMQYKAQLIVIDSIGIGAGVVDGCKQLIPSNSNLHVVAINSASSPEANTVTEDFLNLRAEMWWTAAKEVAEGKFKLENDPKLIDELCGVKYIIKNGKIKIEDKTDIKKRIGSSPNRADAVIMGIWARKKCIPIIRRERAEKNTLYRNRNNRHYDEHLGGYL